MVGRVGRDPYGDDLVASLRAAGIDPRYVLRDPTRHSGVAVIFIDAQGENYVNAVYGANGGCDQQQVADAREAIKEATVLLVQQEIPLDVTFQAMTTARGSGVTVILDPAPTRSPLPDGFLAVCDFLTPKRTRRPGCAGSRSTASRRRTEPRHGSAAPAHGR